MNSHTIDADGKSLGRLASEVAALLNGKNRVDFVKNRVLPVSIKIVNASKVKVTGKKMQESVHKRYSGYPGGLTELALVHVVKNKGFSEVLRHAIYGMLPKNKLQDIRMKSLTIEE